MTAPAPYPLRFRPLLYEKVWGGRSLERYGKSLPPGALIGESWEVADMPATSAAGAGGAAARSVIEHGPLARQTLHEALTLWGKALLGGAPPTPGGDFPLLVKLLDARENLSVQVHPSPAYAAAHAGAHLKTECWLVLDAAPGALIYAGLRPGVTIHDLARAVARGAAPEVLHATPAVPGHCHTLPSGTIHALGAGVVVAEVQTASDTTFRLHDWGRSGRAMHVREALECVQLGPAPTATTAGPAGAILARTDQFVLESGRLADGGRRAAVSTPNCVILLGLAGTGVVRTAAGDAPAGRGAAVLLPAALAPGATIHAMNPAGFEWLAVTLTPAGP